MPGLTLADRATAAAEGCRVRARTSQPCCTAVAMLRWPRAVARGHSQCALTSLKRTSTAAWCMPALQQSLRISIKHRRCTHCKDRSRARQPKCCVLNRIHAAASDAVLQLRIAHRLRIYVLTSRTYMPRHASCCASDAHALYRLLMLLAITSALLLCRWTMSLT